MSVRKLRVFLTVDTEIWPYAEGWPARRLADDERDMSRQFGHCILGASDRGEFGVRYQMALLNRHGLRATFFVEPLHSAAVGTKWLSETVGMIVDAGHDVQLHAHTEWLSDAADPALPAGYRQHMRNYELHDQARILAWGRQRLEELGGGRSVAFRAGNFGANADTLRALGHVGLTMDSSANRCYAGGACHLDVPDQPVSRDNVVEFPMTVFRDYPGHVRPAQLVACSSREMEQALWQAREHGWPSFVVLWHGPELLQQGFHAAGRGRPARMIVRRFERLCRFLDEHRDKFETVMFSRIEPREFLEERPRGPLASSVMLTAQRMAEQAIGRFL